MRKETTHINSEQLLRGVINTIAVTVKELRGSLLKSCPVITCPGQLCDIKQSKAGLQQSCAWTDFIPQISGQTERCLGSTCPQSPLQPCSCPQRPGTPPAGWPVGQEEELTH